MAAYGSLDLGVAVHVQSMGLPVCIDRVSFFGVGGTMAVFGGTRGYIHHVDGCLFGTTLLLLLEQEALLRSVADGVTRILVDDVGREWANTIFEGEYVPSAEGPKYTDTGVLLPYTATFYGLI